MKYSSLFVLQLLRYDTDTSYDADGIIQTTGLQQYRQ